MYSLGQYYYHAYLPEQPDLIWRNPLVQEAMLGVLHFWLDSGYLIPPLSVI